MPYAHRWATILMVALAPLCALSQQLHPFDVKDDIEMQRFTDPHPEPGTPGSETASTSPDGKYIVAVTTKGILSSDRIESQILLFRTGEIQRAFDQPNQPMPRPQTVATAISFPHRPTGVDVLPVIADLRWSVDGTTLYFRRETDEGFWQLCASDVRTGKVEVLTQPSESVDLVAFSNNVVAYTYTRKSEPSEVTADHIINQDAQTLTGLPLFKILTPDDVLSNAPEQWHLAALRRIHGQWERHEVPGFNLRDRYYFSMVTPFVLSPDGQSIVTLLPVPSIPSAWERYEPAAGSPQLHLRGGDLESLDASNYNRPQRYVRIDLQTGQQTVLIDAPDGRGQGYVQPRDVIWSGDGKQVLLTNTFLPVDMIHDAATNRPCLVASVKLDVSRTSCVLYSPDGNVVNSLLSAGFDPATHGVTVVRKTTPDLQENETYQVLEGGWRIAHSHTERLDSRQTAGERGTDLTGERPRVFVHQSLNDPPTLWAQDARSSRASQLWDPNPQFKTIRFAEASPYSYQDETAERWDGQLIKPLDYVPGRRYPLVVYLYSISRDHFLAGGPFPTAYAARELASVGFAVLLVQKKPTTLSEQDVVKSLRAYRAGVDKLVGEGLVDKTRVGVVGFSQSCWFAVSALERDPKLFAAAILADGPNYGYMQYLEAADSPPLWRQERQTRGTSPFGSGLETWLRDAPGFHVDRIRVPVRMEANGLDAVMGEWEIYGSLRMQGKPVDLIYFPKGMHQHQKPLERFESQQGSVDWFRFWLQGYEDPDPSKRNQYARWKGLSHQTEDQGR